MTQHEWQTRRSRIPEPIWRLALSNPLVNRVCDEFAAGHIVTWEEALSKMVLVLAKSLDETQRLAMKAMASSLPPIVIPKENFK